MVDFEDLRLPPHHLEAEKSVLSCLLLDNDVLYLIESVALTPVDFYQKEHQIIFDAVHELRIARKTVDVVTLSNQLTKGDHLDIVGWIDYLYELASWVITTAMAMDYAKIVKEKAVLRNILKACQQISGDVYHTQDTQTILETIEKGGVLLVDELDTSLHPFITKMLVMMFQSPIINKKNAFISSFNLETNVNAVSNDTPVSCHLLSA